jgi:hypothetical protein
MMFQPAQYVVLADGSDLNRLVMEAADAHLPDGHPKRVEVEPYISSVDAAGLRVTLVIADDSPLEPDDDEILNVILAISDRLAESAEIRAPSFAFASDKELAHLGGSWQLSTCLRRRTGFLTYTRSASRGRQSLYQPP